MYTLRRKVRIISYLAAIILCLAASVLLHGYREAELRRSVQSSYERSLAELTENMEKMTVSLQKTMYTNDPVVMASLCSEIYARSMAASMCLEALPSTRVPLENTGGLIMKTGDYAYSLGKALTAGSEIPGENRDTLKSLYAACYTLNKTLNDSRGSIYEGLMALDNAAESREELLPTAADAATDFEQDFPELPTMIYDGPFSQHIKSMTPMLIENAADVTADEATEALREFVGGTVTVDVTGENPSEEIPAYVMSGKANGSDLFGRVSQKGGQIISFIISRAVETAELDDESAIREAQRFLAVRGMGDLTLTYTQREENTLLLNFAAVQEGVTLYPDLVKVRVALDNGAVLAYEANGYIMCHRQRQLENVTVTKQQAESKAADGLQIQNSKLCVIPTAGKNELLCWEMTCLTPENTHCLVYINGSTGREEKILLLLEDENGTLTQ